MKVLFIAYYFEPFSGVGAKRVSYWAKNFHKLSAESEIEVVTATPGFVPQEGLSVHYVEDTKRGSWAKFFKSDAGASWGQDLKRWFKENSKKYDVILITGGPFLHFRLAGWLKKRNNKAKIVLDFRDPMATNPRFLFNTYFFKSKNQVIKFKIKNQVIKFLEKQFVKSADHIITVNESCLGLIAGINGKKTSIIDNGYDEKVVEKVLQINKGSQSKKTRIVYAGSFFIDRNPDHLLQVIDAKNELQERIEFVHIGKQSDFLQKYKGASWIKEYGQKSYSETLNILTNCDYGLIFTIGHPFESTTKVFDYIGLNLSIIVIANSIPDNGPLITASQAYPYFNWIENNSDSISAFFETLDRLNIQKNTVTDVSQFSRKAGLKKLVSVLKGVK